MLRDLVEKALALRLAARGQYSVHPNPQVGCVIVRDGAVVGRGGHLRAGEPHAEVYALAEAGELARGATAYVTLEPCPNSVTPSVRTRSPRTPARNARVCG